MHKHEEILGFVVLLDSTADMHVHGTNECIAACCHTAQQ